MGAPRSRHHRGRPRSGSGPRPGRLLGWTARRQAAPRCSGSSTPRTSISAPATTISASRRRPSANGSSPPSRRPSTSPSREKVDLFLIAGDLFDSNVQPRRSVERVAAELKRLAEAQIRTVIIPGTHDVYDRASIYRAYDLAALAGSTPGRRHGHGPRPGPAVGPPRDARRGRPRPASSRTKRAPHSPLQGFDRTTPADGPAATWRIGMVHGSIAIPGKTDRDEVVITTDEIAASGLDYLALGHWHSTQVGRAGPVTYAYAGAPEPVALDQDRAGKVLLVELDERAGERHGDGRGAPGRPDDASTKIEVDAADGREPAGPGRRCSRRGRTRTSSSTSGSSASVPTSSTSHLDEIETALAPSFLKVRVRDASLPALTEGPLPSAGHDRRGVHPRPRGAHRASWRRPARRPRPPSSATRSGSGACCSPATRCRCEGPPDPAAATSGAIAPSTSSSRPA